MADAELEPMSTGGDGTAQSAEALFPLVYEELRQYARRLFQRQNLPCKTLQPTAVVHEVFVRLAAGDAARPEGARQWADRTHFFATAARALRMVLADHARAQNAAKRGGLGWERVTLELAEPGSVKHSVDLVALDEALARLSALDERQAKIVELRLFGGLNMDEVAQCVGVSKRTAELDWRMARAWLEGALRDSE